MLDLDLPSGVTKEVAEQLLEFQRRCLCCGNSWPLHIHHRIFKSEGEREVREHLVIASKIYERCYGKVLVLWSLHSIQNLVVLCLKCHEGKGVGVHGGNERLRHFLKNSFTCPITGFNIPFFDKKKWRISLLNKT